MKLKTLLSTLLTTTLLAATVATGFGQAIFTESFNYPTPAYVGGNGNAGSTSNGWTTHSVTTGQTTTIDVQDGSLSYPGLEASVGNMILLPGSNSTVSRDINAPFTTSSTTVYYSALINVVDATQLSATAPDYFMCFGATAGTSVTSLAARLGIMSVNSAANYQLSICNNSGTGTNYTQFVQNLDFGTTYLVVVKLDASVSPIAATLWIDPVSLGGAEPATGFVTNNSGANSFAAFASICLRNGSGTPKVNIDEIRVGTTFADVTPAGAPDTQAPVATFDPANGATDVSSAVTPTITFNETIHNTSDGSLVTDPTSLITFTKTDAMGAVVPFTATINGTSEIITVTPTSSLTPGQVYYLAIAPVQDAAGNAATAEQSITFTTAATLSNETNITGFTLAGVDGTLDAVNHTVSVVLPYGTDVTALEPTITLSTGATASPTGAQDFTNPVTYTVTAEDGVATQDWTVTVTFSAPEFTATYPKSANIGKNQFDVVVNLKNAAKVYYMMLASGAAAPTSAEVKAANNVIDVTAAATDFPATISGLDASTTYDVYFVTEDNGGTILMDTPVKLSVTTSAGTLTIHDVQYTTDPSGASMYNNQIVTLNGTVTAIKNTSAGAYSGFYMQDAAGAWNGIYVYTNTYTVAPGDNVSVTGTVVEYKYKDTYLSTLTQISSPSDVTIISSGNTLPEATLVSTLDANSEAYESVLVKVENATCTGNPSTGTFTVDDGTGVLNLYRALFPTLALTTGTVYNVTGIMTDYSNDNTQMYELYPRGANDVTLATGIGQNNTEATQVFPNPFTSNFTVNSGKVVSTVSIYNLLGQKLMERSYSAAEVTVPAANLTNGIYIVNVRFQDGSAATLRMVKK